MKIPIGYTISTERCVLRAPSESDIPHIFSATRNSGFNDGMAWGPPETLEELKAPLFKNLELWREGRSYTLSIDAKESGIFLGRIVIRITEQVGVWSLGFWTHPVHQGRGYMTEAGKAVLNFGFTTLGAERIEACHVVSNLPSRRVLEKLGMRQIELLREGLKKGDVWLPEYKMAIERNRS